MGLLYERILTNEVHKLFTGLCLIESTCKIGSGRYGILFFNPTHLHTHVLGFHNHHYAQGIHVSRGTLDTAR